MASCIFCNTPLEEGTLICDVCGSSQPEQPATRPAVPMAPAIPAPIAPAASTGVAGPRLTLYGPDRSVKHVFALTKDATLIGRLDPVEGNFPDIDVRDWLDDAQARKVSRSHALILRRRASHAFVLRPLPGNSGTQLEADMVAPGEDYTLYPGARFVLGGAVRFKFETD